MNLADLAPAAAIFAAIIAGIGLGAAAILRVGGLSEAAAGNRREIGMVHERFDRVDERLGRIEGRLDRVDDRFERVDDRFERIDARFERMDARFDRIDERFIQADEATTAKITQATTQITEQFAQITEQITGQLRAEMQWVRERFDQQDALNQERARRQDEMYLRLEELVRFEAEQSREQMRLLRQAIMNHTHAEDGAVMFRVPPPEADQ